MAGSQKPEVGSFWLIQLLINLLFIPVIAC